jgi:hypothetical protein
MCAECGDPHAECKLLYKTVRDIAVCVGIRIPRHLTAIRSTKRLFFVESRDLPHGEYVQASCCAWDAKGAFISILIDRQEKTDAMHHSDTD